MRGGSYLIIISLWVVLFYILGISHVKHSEGLGFAIKRNVSFLLPQGWGFFTRNPRETILEVYQIQENDNKMSKVLTKNTSIKNHFGLSRNNRYIGYEMSKLIGYIPKGAWLNGVGHVKDNLPDTTFLIESEHSFKTFKPQTDYLILQYKPIPISWASQNQEKYRPYLAARIKLQ
ncbi:MAG: SdpA family antimicrobial peptide system protein [Bacteroidota bacterium]